MPQANDLVDILKLAGDITRLRILSCLRENELAVNELVEILEMNQSAVSNQLSLLKKTFMVNNRKEGKRIFYSLNPELKKGPHGQLFQQIFQQALEQDQLQKDMQMLEGLLQRRREESLAQFRNRKNKDNSCPGEGWEATARGFIQLIRNKNIADLGSGSGRLAAILAEAGNRVTGYDNNPEQLEEARKWESSFNGRLSFKQCNIEESQNWKGDYDLAILSHTLHHLTHPARVLKNVASMVKPGEGQLLIFDLAAHEEEIFRELFGDFWLGFPEDTLKQWLEEAGFGDILIEQMPPQEEQLKVRPLIVTARKLD